MPISRDEFEHRQIEPARYVEQLLRSFMDTAFSPDEILEIAGREGRNSTREEIQNSLDALVDDGKLECTEVKGIVYYIYKHRPLGFGRGGG